ncbi:hypothetical protein HDU96_002072 [Phlyctochytrium bullatum]|nr:hypothetical protein HDU96_002072 [Phlyctochytrium bullatum]
MKTLLRDGVDPCGSNYLPRPPLHHAIERGNLDAAMLLLEFGADPSEGCWWNRTALHWWAARSEWGRKAEKLLMQLLEKGVDPNAKDEWGATALHMAARGNKADLLLPLLEIEGVDPHVVDFEYRETWLDAAYRAGLENWLMLYEEELLELGVHIAASMHYL